MANKNGKQSAQEQYNKELRRIQNFIKKAQAQGLQFDDEFITDFNVKHHETKGKKITKSDVNRLKNITPEFMYSRSVGVDTSTGKIVSGKQAISQQMIDSNRLPKSVIDIPIVRGTQSPEVAKIKRKEWYNNLSEEQKQAMRDRRREWYNNLSPEQKERMRERQRERYKNLTPEQKQLLKDKRREWYKNLSLEKKEEIRRKQREARRRKRERERLEKDKAYKETFTSSNIIKNRLEELLDKFNISHPKATSLIRQAMNEIISEIGEDTFVKSLDEFRPDIVERMELMFVKYNDWMWDARGFTRDFIFELRGGMSFTQEEAQKFEEAFDEDEYMSADDFDGEIPFE